MDQIRKIMRPTDVPDTGLLCDLLWSDPDKDVVGWGENGMFRKLSISRNLSGFLPFSLLLQSVVFPLLSVRM